MGNIRPSLKTGRPGPQLGEVKIFTTQFSAHICCSQMAGWIKMPLGMEVGLSPGDFVLDGIPLYPDQKLGQSPLPNFRLTSVLDGNPAPSLNCRPMFIIVIAILLEHCTKHSGYWFIQVQVKVLYSLHSIFRKV